MRHLLFSIAGVFALCVAFFVAAWGWILCTDTLAPKCIGFVIAFVAGGMGAGIVAGLSFAKERPLKPLTGIGIFLFFGSMAYGTLYIVNYYTAMAKSAECVRVRVTDKEHYYKMVANRVGRHGATRGKRRVDVYEVTLELPSGEERVVEVRGKQYTRIYKRREYDLPVAKGCFGMKVMVKDDMQLVGPEPQNRYTPRRCRYVGPKPGK